MTIAPNGVTMASYDPKGVGAQITAHALRADLNAAGYAAALENGDLVSGSILKFAGVGNNAAGEAFAAIQGAIGVGTWMCTGGLNLLDNGTISGLATTYIRVS